MGLDESGISRRQLFPMLPAALSGCAGCLAAAQAPQFVTGLPWTDKADMTWEGIFRFAYQKEYIPLLKDLAKEYGEERFIALLKESVSRRAKRGMEGKQIPKRDFATFIAGFRAVPPIMQHALTVEILEDTPQAFEIKVTRCLWAKCFRESGAADIGYALICYPDYAVAAGFNPNIKLIRTRSLMQGAESCSLRYVTT